MIFFIVFILGVVVTTITNRLLLAFAKNLGIRGEEKVQVRWAAASKPSLGGVAFFLSFLGIIAFTGLTDFQYTIFSKNQFIGIFLACSTGFAIGFADDTYNTNPKLKLFGQIACAVILILFDIKIDIGYIWLDYFITVLWVIGIMNSINMIDNMDAVTASISILILVASIIFFVGNGYNDEITIILVCGIIGSLVGFLYHNWPPAKMYMGDAGSQFLGIFLAIISIRIFWDNEFVQFNGFFDQFIVPILIFIIPIIDTLTVIYYRIKNKTSPMVGGADHTTHHLIYSGFSHQKVLLLFYLIYLCVFSILTFSILSGYSFASKLITLLFILVTFFYIQHRYKVGIKFKNQKREKENLKIRQSKWDSVVKKIKQ